MRSPPARKRVDAGSSESTGRRRKPREATLPGAVPCDPQETSDAREGVGPADEPSDQQEVSASRTGRRGRLGPTASPADVRSRSIAHTSASVSSVRTGGCHSAHCLVAVFGQARGARRVTQAVDSRQALTEVAQAIPKVVRTTPRARRSTPAGLNPPPAPLHNSPGQRRLRHQQRAVPGGPALRLPAPRPVASAN